MTDGRDEAARAQDAAARAAEGASSAAQAASSAQQLQNDPVGGATGLANNAAGMAGAAGAPHAQEAQQAMGAASQAASSASQTAQSAQALQNDPVGGLLGMVGGASGLAGSAASAAGASQKVTQATQAISSASSAASSVAGLAQRATPSTPAATPSTAAATSPVANTAPAATPAVTPATTPASTPAAEARSNGPASARSEQGSWSFTSQDRHVHYRLDSEADGASSWTLRTFRLDERLDQPFECIVDVTSDDTAAEPLAFLGKSTTIEVARGSLTRNVTGIVRRVVRGASGGNDRHVVATLTIVPGFWALSRNRETRVFQEKKVPEILKEVIERGLGTVDREVRFDLQGTYQPREYCVQWEESDFDFVSRLMEEEGIFYFFDFSEDREVLVISDVATAFVPLETEDGNPVPFSPLSQGGGPIEAVLELVSARSITPNKAMVREYDWTRPATDFNAEAELTAPDEHGDIGTLEEYYHGPVVHFSQYSEPSFGGEDAAKQADLLTRRRGVQVDVARGRSELSTLTVGMKFELSGHPHAELDREWLVVAVHHEGANGGEGNGDDEEYINRVELIPASTDYRPRRTRFKQRVHSVLTAKVVGPSGEEIHTDVHGRVKVQFHWDRLGARNEHSSCFLRSMQPWAGQGWGFVFLPRIGMEVVVSFVDGDIDRPLVMGSVYQGANHVPPLDLPNERTKSTIKTSSSPGGDGYNELTFEDAAGSEQIIIHAQKDMNETIENNHSTSVGADQSNSVGGNRTHSVSKNETLTITGSQKITISGAEQGDGMDIKGGQLDITGKYKLDASDEIMVQAPNKITLTCGGSSITMEPSKITITAGGGSSVVLDANAFAVSSQGTQMLLDANACVQSSGASQMLLDANASMQSSGGSRVILDANASMSASGGGQVVLDANASVHGANATLGGDTAATVTAPTATLAGAAGSVEAAAAGVTASGPKVDVTGSGAVNISGAVVKIN